MSFREDFLTALAKPSRDALASQAVSPTSPLDDFASPAERAPVYDGPAPRQGRARSSSASQQEVWNAIANRHPRKFKKAVAYLKWLDRMERSYSSRIL